MRRPRFADLALGTVLVLVAAGVAAAQTDPGTMSPLEKAVACAPPPSFDGPPPRPLHILGSQDTVQRALLGPRDLLVVDGGTEAGLQLGQQFFVRRMNTFGTARGAHASAGTTTAGWISIVAVNGSTAIASVDHACGPLLEMDFLVPFVAPVLPAGADRDEAPGQPDFMALGRIVTGGGERVATAPGDFVLIDQGSDQGVIPGARFALFRDVGPKGTPLASVGEAIVISTGTSMSLTRITRARDVVYGGDYVAPRK
jgi:hypothetical protein